MKITRPRYKRTLPAANSHGFTIVELLVSIAVAAILATVILSISLYMFGEATRSRMTAELAVESHYVLRTMVEDIRLADGLATTNTIPDTNAPSGSWTTDDTNNVLIIDSPALNSSRDIIYDPMTGFPYRNQLVYFMDGGTLHKRILSNGSATDNSAVTTCPANAVSRTCPADRTYTNYIDGYTFIFYDTNNAVTSNPALARSVKITVTMSRKTYGKTISFVNSIQTTMRNQ